MPCGRCASVGGIVRALRAYLMLNLSAAAIVAGVVRVVVA